MSQEKFVNTYIELLNATVTEAIQKNLVMQAQKRIIEEENGELTQAIKDIEEGIKAKFAEKDNEIRLLIDELNGARRQIGQFSEKIEEAKTASEHFDTYKKELVEARMLCEERDKLIKEKDKLILEKDKKLTELGHGPKPVVLNKIQKIDPLAPLESQPKVEKQKTAKVKTVRDAGSF